MIACCICFSLSSDWGVSLEEAEETLRLWYADRPEVKEWQQLTIAAAHRYQTTRTLMGRYRPLPEITSSSPAMRSHAERAAINTPIQGGAADVVMKAMLKIHENQGLRELGYRVILQIHDEVSNSCPWYMIEHHFQSVDCMTILRCCVVRFSFVRLF